MNAWTLRYLAGMESSDLTPEQARKIMAALSPALDYLEHLMARMQKKGFDRDDELWKRTRRARLAMLGLVAELRSLTTNARSN